MAADFVSVTRDGKEVLLADHAGKVVVRDFWATWWGPCVAAMPHVQAIAEQHKAQDVVVLASCTRDERAKSAAWVDRRTQKRPDVRSRSLRASRASTARRASCMVSASLTPVLAQLDLTPPASLAGTYGITIPVGYQPSRLGFQLTAQCLILDELFPDPCSIPSASSDRLHTVGLQ